MLFNRNFSAPFHREIIILMHVLDQLQQKSAMTLKQRWLVALHLCHYNQSMRDCNGIKHVYIDGSPFSGQFSG